MTGKESPDTVFSERDRRQELLTAALRVFGRYGYQKAAVRQIAEEAGCGTGTFYLYFASKDECFLALVNRLYSQVMQAVVRERAQAQAPLPKLQSSLRALTRVFSEERELARVVLTESLGPDPMLREHLWQVRDTFVNFTAENLLECGLNRPESLLAARAWVGALAEIIDYWVRIPDQAIELDQAVQTVAQWFLAGWGIG